MAQKLLDTASLLLNIKCEVTFALPYTYLRFSTHFERNGLNFNRRWEGRYSHCMQCTFFSRFFFEIGNSWAVYSHRRSVHSVIVTLCVGQHYVNCHSHIMYVPEAEIAFGTVPILRRVRLWTRVFRSTHGRGKTGTAGHFSFSVSTGDQAAGAGTGSWPIVSV